MYTFAGSEEQSFRDNDIHTILLPISFIFCTTTTITVQSTSISYLPHDQSASLSRTQFIDRSVWKTFINGFQFKDGPIFRQSTNTVDDPYDDNRCIIEFNEIFNAAGNMELWAIKYFDSWGKLPAGIVQGNFYSFGMFDECLSIDRPLLQPQYCLAEIYTITPGMEQTHALNDPIKMKGMDARMLAFQNQNSNQSLLTIFLGLCVPETCRPELVVELLMPIIASYNLTVGVSVTEPMCTRAGPRPFKTLDVITISVLSIVTFVILFCTIYDVSLRYLKKTRNSLLIAFSAYENGSLLFKCTENNSTRMGCLNGIRVLSIVWVIYGHTYMILGLGPLTNAAEMINWIDNPYSMLMLSAHASVDSFFMIGGLLVAWTMLNYLDQCKGRINIFWMYFHRFIRLTPSLAAAVLICASLIRHMGDGPLWNVYMNAADMPCLNYWWTTLLYVENYVNPDQMCVNHSWYLSVDMQLYVLSPLLVYPLWRWRNKCLPVIPLLVLASMGATFAILYVNDISVRVATSNMAGIRMSLVYYTTHCRMGAWLVGVYTGYVLHSIRGKSVIIPKIWVAIGWTISMFTFISVIFANYPLQVPSYNDSVIGGAFYESISRVAWSAALAWLVFACTQGYGGPVNWFLSLVGWQPLARMSYSIFLVHLPLQLILAAQVKTGTYFGNTQALLSFWSVFGLSLCISLLWTLAFESPIIAIERCLMSPKQKVDLKKPQIQSSHEDLAHERNIDHEVGGNVNWGLQVTNDEGQLKS